ncbi:MAG: hypothetical protein H0W88_00440 [Parachlamydiaceae bacterium]|nr:hypothetical protein [Parachlamydiaceae bacterium]
MNRIDLSLFWTPIKTEYRRETQPYFFYILENGCKWADSYLYLGNKKITVFNQELIPQNELKVIRGEAKKFIDDQLNYKEEKVETNLYQTIQRIVTIFLFIIPLSIAKICYKIFYVPQLLNKIDSQDIHANWNTFLFNNGADTDVICLDISNQLRLLENELLPYNKGTKDAFSLKVIIKIIHALKEIQKNDPTHHHANFLLNNINENGSVLCSLLKTDEEKLEFIDLLYQTYGKELRLPPKLAEFYQVLDNEYEKQRFYRYFCINEEKPVFLKNILLLCFGTTEDSFTNLKKLPLLSLLIRFYTGSEDVQSIKAFEAIAQWIVEKDRKSVLTLANDNGYTVFQGIWNNCILAYPRDSIPQPIIKLSNKIEKIDNNFTLEIYYRKLLANLFGIDTNSIIADQAFTLASLFQFNNNHPLHIPTFLKPFLEESIKELYKESIHQKTILEKAFPYLSQESNDHYNSFHIIRDEHQINIVQFREYLLVGNQGMGCGEFSGITIFKMNEDKFNGQDINNFDFTSLEKEGKISSDFFEQPFLKDIESEYVGHIPLAAQNIENCPWKSWKASIISTLFILSSYDELQYKSFESVQKSHEKDCKNLARALAVKVKTKVLQSYVHMHFNKEFPWPIEENLMNLINVKLYHVRVGC